MFPANKNQPPIGFRFLIISPRAKSIERDQTIHMKKIKFFMKIDLILSRMEKEGLTISIQFSQFLVINIAYMEFRVNGGFKKKEKLEICRAFGLQILN